MKLLLGLIATFIMMSQAQAKMGQFGVNLGGGLPYTTQVGVNYFISDKFSAEFRYSMLSVDVDLASVSLSQPEVNAKWHPFSGSFYLGLGLGSFSLSIEATDATTGLKAKADISATAVTASLGWLWGIDDGGFFGGFDLGYQMPQGADAKITGPLVPTDDAYKDAEDAAEVFGETGLPVISLLRLGYMF